MVESNLKIPLPIAKDYKLSASALLVYGELYGLFSKNSKCYITDKTLSKRLGFSKSTIQRAMKQLKDHGLIISKQKPNYKGRNITVLSPKSKQFLLIPIALTRDKKLKPASIVLYGSLYAKMKKIIKINKDKRQDMDAPLIETNKSKLANELGKKPEIIRLHLLDLYNYGYLQFNSIDGKGLVIELTNKLSLHIPKKKSKNDLVKSNSLPNKWASTYLISEHPPTYKMSIHLPNKWATNRINNKYLIKEKNKDHSASFEVGKPLSKPIYYDSIPDDKDIPPEEKNFDSNSYIKELNQLDKQKSVNHKSAKHKDGKQITSVNFDLDSECQELQSIARELTGKHYIITSQQKTLIELRLKQGFTINDFRLAIIYLKQHNKPIILTSLISNIGNIKKKATA